MAQVGEQIGPNREGWGVCECVCEWGGKQAGLDVQEEHIPSQLCEVNEFNNVRKAI